MRLARPFGCRGNPRCKTGFCAPSRSQEIVQDKVKETSDGCSAQQPGCRSCLYVIGMQDVCLEQRVQESEEFTPEVTRISHSPTADTIAAGYANGSIRIWDTSNTECVAVLQSHSGSISALAFNSKGGLIASGSQDTDIIVWDVAGEVGLYKLKAHTNQVTAVLFLDTQNKLLSAGKDGFVRVWDLAVQFCIQVVPIHSGNKSVLHAAMQQGSADAYVYIA